MMGIGIIENIEYTQEKFNHITTQGLKHEHKSHGSLIPSARQRRRSEEKRLRSKK